MTTVATKVGDRYVLEEMREKGYAIGGEQSGHTIFLEHATTGDGELTSLQVLHIVKESGKSLETLANQMKKYPQQSVNIKADAAQKQLFESDPEIQSQVQKAEDSLQGEGRIIVRVSGTEPLIRVLAEGKDETKTRETATALASWIEQRIKK